MDYTQIIDGVYGVLGIVGTGVLTFCGKTAVRFLRAKHLDLIAAKAVGFVADYFKTASGQIKLQKACRYVTDEIDRIPGFKRVTEKQVEQVVRAAYQKIYGVAVATEQGPLNSTTFNIHSVQTEAKKDLANVVNQVKSAALDTAAKVATTAIEKGIEKTNDAATITAGTISAKDVMKAPETAQESTKAADDVKAPETTKEAVKPVETKQQMPNITPTAEIGKLQVKDLESIIDGVVSRAISDFKKF